MERWIDAGPWPTVARWWSAQGRTTKLAVAVAAVFTVASMLNLMSASFGRMSQAALPAASTSTALTVAPAALTLESPPADADPAKNWASLKTWQGTGNRETEAFTVAEHWRVDWMFNPVQPGGILQVFIYHSNGRLLMNLAANAQKSGSDTSFWAGAGTYFLKVNSSGGDWKIGVQDLRNEIDSAWVSQSPVPAISVGEQATLTFRFRNTGKVAWRRSTASEVSLAFIGDDRRFDPRMAVDWPLPSRPATQIEDEIAPGELATFAFKVRGVAPGTYRIDLRPTMSSVGWLRAEGVYSEVTVR